MASGQLGQVLQQLRRMVGGPATDATDRQLLEHYAATGDEAAFTQLVRRHGPMVQGVCRRVLGRDPEADDAFQAAFLVLARKAGSVFWQESVGNWLYGVAYRTASKVRVRSARRRRLEQEAAGNRGAAAAENGDAHELQQVLDEELIRLPEKFRMPVLLCCLQDQTIDEAAQQLGWSCATVKGRLQRGREMLRGRLERRGIGLSAGVLATILTQGVVNATPPVLLKTTIQTVVTGTSTDSVAALAQGVMQAMFWTKLKTAALVLLAVAVLGGGAGTVFYHGGASTAAPLPRTDQLTGRLLDASGKLDMAALDQLPYLLERLSFEERAVQLKHLAAQLRPAQGVRTWKAADGSVELTVGAANTNILNYRPIGTKVSVVAAGDGLNLNQNSQRGGEVHLAAMPPSGVVYALSGDGSPVGGTDWSSWGAGGGGCGVVSAGTKSCYAPPFDHFRHVEFDKLMPRPGNGRGWCILFSVAPLPEEVKKQPPAKPDSSEPAVKDGLSIGFRPAKVVFAEKEPLEFTVTIKNVSDSPLLLYDLDDLRYFGVQVGDWTPAWMGKAQRKPQSEDSKLLKPGETRDLRLRYEGAVLYHWTGPQRGLPQPRNHLDPGKYQVTVSRDFTANPVLGKEIKERQWTGKIASNTLEIEIAADKPAAAPSVKDANSGITVAVTDDAKVLTATDADGKVIWKLNLVAAAKDFLGTPAIGSVAINAQGQVEARFGKSNLARIDLKTGKLLEHLAR